MALLVSALALLLVLQPLLSAQGAGQASSSRGGESKTPGVCTTMAGDWPPSVAAVSTRTEFAVGEGVEVTCCQEQYEVLTFHMQCTERAGQATWDTSNVRCVEKCQKPSGDPAPRFEPDKSYYGSGEWVTLSCLEGFDPSQPEIRCIRQGSRNGWSGTAACLEKCKAPSTSDSRVQFDRTQQFYSPGDSVTWRCPAGYRPSAPEISCTRSGSWSEWSGTAACTGTPQIISGDLEVSPTTIKLRWTCSPAKSCQGSWKIHARCQPDGSLPGPCPRPAGTREQTSQGLEGTLTCSSLQPFTSYKVTISGNYPATSPARSTVLYSQRVNTSETAPDRPETEPLDLTTKTVSWKKLPPCKGTIVGYQLNITARREYDSSFLKGEVLRVNRSVTKYRLQPWRHGTNYTVTIQGLTAAGPGQASRWDFETEISEPAIHPDVTALSVYDISPSSGTAVLPLQPIPGLHGPIREYQIIVSAMQNGSGADACHAPDLQLFNASLEHAAYLAAVLPAHKLTGPTAFVLGDGARHNGYLNAPLRPSRNYTAFVRVVSRWKQIEKSSCVHYNFAIGEAQRAPPGGVAVAVAVPVLVLAAGALLLGFVCCRKRQALASRSAKDAGEALYTELQPRDAPDIYCTIQTQVQGAAGKDLAPAAPRRTEEIWDPPTAAAGPRAKRQRTRELEAGHRLARGHEN